MGHDHGRTERLDLGDATLREWDATVLDVDDDGIVLDRSAFYPGGGGQPPDHGVLLWGGVQTRIVGARRGDIVRLVLAETLLLGVAASAAGIALGLALLYVLRALTAWQLAFAARIPLQALGAAVILSMLAALIPAADGHTLYAPAKSYLVKFSEALALENADKGVHVTALCPGFTWSEFHDVTGNREIMNRMPRWIWLQADEVARAGIDAAERGKVLAVPGLVYKLVCVLVKLLPNSWLLALMKRNSRRFRRVD